ncbi:MAG: hypothetical protein R3242_08245 [Akkermansiaceae bacterium]|nr:hypothetical protein [Akkermansiaceae bacterium]
MMLWKTGLKAEQEQLDRAGEFLGTGDGNTWIHLQEGRFTPKWTENAILINKAKAFLALKSPFPANRDPIPLVFFSSRVL